MEYAHFENAASAYYMAGDIGKAIALSDIVINKLNPNTGKSEYINALAHISIGGLRRACELLQIAIGFGYTQASEHLISVVNSPRLFQILKIFF